MFTVTMTSTSNQNSFSFLETATRNYISARLLFMNGQLYDGGIMAHEAIEKVMKAILYFKLPTRTQVKGHVLNALRPLIESELSLDLSQYEAAFNYYEECYDYRYPDDPKPSSFSTGTTYVHLLDEIFMKFHNYCLSEISEDKVKFISGIYSYCQDYFLMNDESQLNILLSGNDEINKSKIDEAKEYWHHQGIFIKDKNGVTKFPNGSATRER